MFLQTFEINRKSLVADIVAQDYRTAAIFRKYGIGYCCGGKWPMEMACEMNGVNIDDLHAALESAVRTNIISNQLDFADFNTEFIISYIVNVHHQYLNKTLKGTQEMLVDFAKEHNKKYTYLCNLEQQFGLLVQELLLSVKQEEEIIFPYIRHLTHAYKHKEPYAALMIKTLRKPKPVGDTMFKGHETISDIILSIRELTGSYTIPANVCISHKVVLSKLKELDNDLAQHLYLEQSLLFPRAAAIEKELLGI